MSASDSPTLVCVDPKRVVEIWPHIRHFVQAALRRGDLGRFGDLERHVLSGNALLWLAYRKPVIEAVAVTQIITTDSARVCMIQACGGSQMRRWIGLIDGIEQYAKSQGCRCTRILGRRGWSRVLKHYRETKVILERPL